MIIALAARHRLPRLILSLLRRRWRLISYGPGYGDPFRRRRQGYVDRILRAISGRPAVQVVKYELVINLKTAKRARLDMPSTLLAAPTR